MIGGLLTFGLKTYWICKKAFLKVCISNLVRVEWISTLFLSCYFWPSWVINVCRWAEPTFQRASWKPYICYLFPIDCSEKSTRFRWKMEIICLLLFNCKQLSGSTFFCNKQTTCHLWENILILWKTNFSWTGWNLTYFLELWWPAERLQ